MSSTTAPTEEASTVVDVAVVAAVEKPPRKFPPPCWTQEETLALIDAYRERWYALRRGYLRTADWDAVAEAVSQRCPDASPAKTSAQCRHKMEKLRQRYRAEKQRSLAYPTGRFFSSWFFFENMDAMENGTSLSAVGSNQDHSGNGFRLKTLLDQNILKLKLNQKKFDVELDPKLNFDTAKNDGKLSSNYGSKALSNAYSPYMDMGSYKEEEEENDIDIGGGYCAKNNPVVEIKAKKLRNLFAGVENGFDVDQVGNKGFGVSNGMTMRNSMNDEMLPPGMRAKKFGKVERRVNLGFDGEGGGGFNGNACPDGFWVKVANDRNLVVPQGSRGKYIGSVEGSHDSRGLNGYSSVSGSGVEKTKRGRDPVEEMVSSIKMLGEGFVKMEKMKMDMARETEKMRMEMEMKRNELILESQKQIVEAFVKGFMEIKNKKSKTTVASES